MKHLLHLLRADVRRFRWLLPIWVLIQILDTAFTGMRPVLDSDPRLVTVAGLAGTMLALAGWLGLILIVPLVVQTHPLVGSDAFWMTRPIPWHALFASKIVLLGTTFVIVPVLCELVLMLACRVPAADIARVALQTTLFQALWLLTVMALSAVTRDLSRFALVAGGLLIGFVLLINVAIAVMIRTTPDGPQLTEVTERFVQSSTPGVVMLLLVIMAALVQLVLQYRTRSARASVGAGATGIALVVLIAFIGPWRVHPIPVPAWASEASALRLFAESQKGEFRRYQDWPPWHRSGGWQTGGARLRLSGIEQGWLATAALAESTVRFADGTTLTTAGNGYSSPVPFEPTGEAPARVVMRHVLGVARLWQASQGSLAEAVPAIVLSEPDFKKYSGTTGTYQGRFVVSLDRVEIAATLPLQRGSEFRDPGRRMILDQVIPQAEAALVRIRQFTTATMFDSQSVPQLSFYLRNRRAAEAVAGAAHEGMHMSAGLAVPLLFGFSGYSSGPSHGFDATSHFIRFPEAYQTEEQTVDVSADWLSQAELVIVRTVAAGSVARTVEIQGFEIAPAPPKPSR